MDKLIEEIYEDLKTELGISEESDLSIYSNIRGLALYDYNQIGVEGESSHNDNTGTRTWFSRNTYLEGVVAICTLI